MLVFATRRLTQPLSREGVINKMLALTARRVMVFLLVALTFATGATFMSAPNASASTMVKSSGSGTAPRPPAPRPVPPRVNAPAPNPAPRTGSGVHTAPGSAPKVVNRPPAAPTKPTTFARTARASGNSYRMPNGYVYHFSDAQSWYRQYHGGYPSTSSPLYMVMLNSPFYYPNYLPGHPWYKHAYPAGYTLENGQFVSNESSLWWVWIVFGVFVVAAAAAVILTRPRYRRRTWR